MNQAGLDLMRLGQLPASYYLATVLTIALPFDVLQNDDATVTTWAELVADDSVWSGDGRAGQLAADFLYALADTRAARWPAIACPCLIVAHEHDLLFPPRAGRITAGTIPKGEFLEIPGVGHGEVTEAADMVQRAVLDFFART
jgi:thioesterase CepJ